MATKKASSKKSVERSGKRSSKKKAKGSERKSKPNQVLIFDTTLRDGEQSPGCTMTPREKVQLALQLEQLGVDVIEAGFAIASPGDFESVQAVSEAVREPIVCSLSRALPKDIEASGKALKKAKRKRIHTFIATSDIHVQKKLKLGRDKVIELAVEAVKQAKAHTKDIEFSCEDAGRTDWGYICAIIEATIEAGATTVNIPDTVGYCAPWQFGECIRYVREHVPNIKQAVISVHCHNDLGLALANSLAGVLNGARQVECTINGIGERAGNCSLEEVVMNLKTRKDFYRVTTNVKSRELYKASRLLVSSTGMRVQANKAVVGANAFAHEAGIHQDGVLKERSTYEIMTAKSVGWMGENIVLGKHSGRHAFRRRLEAMGYRQLTKKQLQQAFQAFIELSDKKKEIFDDDLRAIAETHVLNVPEVYKLEYLSVISGTSSIPTATVRIRHGDKVTEGAGCCGDGPVDVAYAVIKSITGMDTHLEEYHLDAVTPGQDATGQVTVKIRVKNRLAIGRGSDTDVIVASAKALINALNKIAAEKTLKSESAVSP